QPGAHRHLLPYFVQEFGIGPDSMLERVQFFLQFANQEIGQLVATRCVASGFQVGDGADPIATGIERSKAAIEPGRVDLLRLDLSDDIPLREVEPPGDELRKAVRIDNSYCVEVEIA